MMASLLVCHFVASIRSPTKGREAFIRPLFEAYMS